MIIFKQDEYNVWVALDDKYSSLKNEARRKYVKDKNKEKYENTLSELEKQETNERKQIEITALYRTLENLRSHKILEDAKASIYHFANMVFIRAHAEREALGDPTVEPDFTMYGSAHDFKIEPHLEILRNERKELEMVNEIEELIERYRKGKITISECSPYKDYELIRIEVPVKKNMKPMHGDIRNALVVKNTFYPEEFVTPKDKVSNKLFEGVISPLVETTVMQGSNRKKDISTLVSLNYDELDAVELVNRTKGLTVYDREVADAIVSLYVVGGNKVITDQMIYRVITGNPEAKISKNAQESIEQSVKVLRGTIVKLKASDNLAKAYNTEKIYWEGHLIALETVTAKIKGKYINAYKINRTPVLYQYADSINQVARIPIDLLNTSINKTPEVITLQGYLLRRILAMKGSQLSRVILYSTIFDNIGLSKLKSDKRLTASERNKVGKINGLIVKILEEWKEKTFIVDYKINYKGKTKTIISLEIKP